MIILLLEDELAIIELIERVLKCDGYYVISARTIREARTLYASRRIDLVISDGNVLDGDASEWIAELRDRHQPVLNISSMIEVPGVPRLAKPFKNGTLRTKVRELLPT